MLRFANSVRCRFLHSMRDYAGPEIVGSLTFIITYTGPIFWAFAAVLSVADVRDKGAGVPTCMSG